MVPVAMVMIDGYRKNAIDANDSTLPLWCIPVVMLQKNHVLLDLSYHCSEYNISKFLGIVIKLMNSKEEVVKTLN